MTTNTPNQTTTTPTQTTDTAKPITTPQPLITSPQPLIAARFYHACGYSVIPVVLDGTKKPACEWKRFIAERATPDNLTAWFARGQRGIALVQGTISAPGGQTAELLEFETPEIFERWERGMHTAGHGDLADLLSVRVTSGGGGVHVYYRHTDEPQGNQKLARSATPIPGHKQGADGMTSLIETRGEGGYVVAPGSPVSVHESGRSYRMRGGSFKSIPVLTPGERDAVFAVCREFDERPPVKTKPRQERASSGHIQVRSEEGTRPGDDFNERGARDAIACLERHGWSVARDHGDWQELCRPGKTRGSSATMGYVAPGVLHVFSSNAAPFELDSTCGPFEIVTRLDFAGDFAACARFLGNRGYGTPLPPRSLDRLHAKPAHRTMPDETGDEPIPCVLDGPSSVLDGQSHDDHVRQGRQMLARMASLMRLAELGMVDWPAFRVAAEQDEESKANGETVIGLNGETVIDVGNLAMTENLLSVDSTLLITMRNTPVSDAIRMFESELESHSAERAYRMLWQIDHLFDCADVYLEHMDCVEHYQGPYVHQGAYVHEGQYDHALDAKNCA